MNIVIKFLSRFTNSLICEILLAFSNTVNTVYIRDRMWNVFNNSHDLSNNLSKTHRLR